MTFASNDYIKHPSSSHSALYRHPILLVPLYFTTAFRFIGSTGVESQERQNRRVSKDPSLSYRPKSGGMKEFEVVPAFGRRKRTSGKVLCAHEASMAGQNT